MGEFSETLFMVLDSVRDLLCTADANAFAASRKRIPDTVLLLFATYFVNGEIQTHGLREFLKRPAGILVPEAVQGFDVMEMPQIAFILKSAIEPLGEPFPRGLPERLWAILSCSGKTTKEVEEIFERARHAYDPAHGASLVFGQPKHAAFRHAQSEYAAYQEVAATYGWFKLEKQYLDLIDKENGGFEQLATRYAEEILEE